MAGASPRSTPARSTASVTIRYIAPVSRYRAPSARAKPLDTEDFPVPAGPSTAITTERAHMPTALYSAPISLRLNTRMLPGRWSPSDTAPMSVRTSS